MSGPVRGRAKWRRDATMFAALRWAKPATANQYAHAMAGC